MPKGKGTGALPFDEEPPSDGSNAGRSRRRSKSAQQQEFFLPVSGFVWLYPEELAVINHPAFQRLAKINQLGQAHLVFRGATHKRIEHVIGAVCVAQQMIAAIRFNSQREELEQSKHPFKEQNWRSALSDEEERFIRLGALLHDIGHLAAGHTLEDELGLFGKHDEDPRLDYIFGDDPDPDPDLGRPPWEAEPGSATLASVIDDVYEDWLPPDLEGKGVAPSRLVRLLIRKPPTNPKTGEYDPSLDGKYRDAHKALFNSSDLRAGVCTNIIGNTICADLLDYISRDWYHVGKPIRSEDRIYQYMEIRNPAPEPPDIAARLRNRRHWTDKFVLALGSNEGRAPKIRTDGVSAILGLLERRFELGETVLYHRTKLAAGAMLGRALFELWEGENLWPRLLDLSDEQLVDFALSEADQRQVAERLLSEDGDLTARERKEAEARGRRAKTAKEILIHLRSRKLYKAFYTERHWSITSEQKEKLNELFAPDGDKTSKGARLRTRAARLLEDRFRLEPGSIVVSLTNVRPKIAQVEVHVNGNVVKFNKYEEDCEKKNRHGLSGGHLKAQIKRFEDLWRLDFFMEPVLYEEMKSDRSSVLDLMKDAIDQVFINAPPDKFARKRAADRIEAAYLELDAKAAKSNSETLASLDSLWTSGEVP